MTKKQIILNADVYANNIDKGRSQHRYLLIREAYIEGAYSRDEEVENLENALHSVNEYCHQLRNKVYELSNPWISVEKRLPEENCVVFVSLDGTEYLSAHFRVKSKRFVTVSKDKQTLVEVRKSSATYSVCGDCIKEEPLYSKGEREDITSLVTHWMPILPKLKKGEYKL